MSSGGRCTKHRAPGHGGVGEGWYRPPRPGQRHICIKRVLVVIVIIGVLLSVLKLSRQDPQCLSAPASDLNDDCIVDVADLIILANNWMSGLATDDANQEHE